MEVPAVAVCRVEARSFVVGLAMALQLSREQGITLRGSAEIVAEFFCKSSSRRPEGGRTEARPPGRPTARPRRRGKRGGEVAAVPRGPEFEPSLPQPPARLENLGGGACRHRFRMRC